MLLRHDAASPGTDMLTLICVNRAQCWQSHRKRRAVRSRGSGRSCQQCDRGAPRYRHPPKTHLRGALRQRFAEEGGCRSSEARQVARRGARRFSSLPLSANVVASWWLQQEGPTRICH